MTRSPRVTAQARRLMLVVTGALAASLRFLSWWQAAILGGLTIPLAVALLLELAPRHGSTSADRQAVRRSVTIYAAAVAGLLLLFFDRLDIAAASLGILAVGLPAAATIRRQKEKASSGRERTAGEGAALVLAGGAAGAALAWWCRPHVVPPAYPWFSLGAPFLAALAAAAVRTLPIVLDDLLLIPFTAAAVLWAISLVSADLAAAAIARAWTMLPAAVLANAAAAAAGYVARTVTRGGATCGAVIGILVLTSAGWAGWALLLLTFGAAALASRIGAQRKTRLAIAEPHGGRRGPGNAIANTGVATVAAWLAVLTYAHDPALTGFVAALTAGGSDTVASEIGKAWTRRPRLVTTWRSVPAGTPGAISVAGTAAGFLSALALGGAAAALGLVGRDVLLPVVIGATAGAFAESALAATLEHRGVVNNDVLNFMNTGVAAAVAIWVAGRS